MSAGPTEAVTTTNSFQYHSTPPSSPPYRRSPARRNMITLHYLMIVVYVFNDLNIEKCFVLKTICTFN